MSADSAASTARLHNNAGWAWRAVSRHGSPHRPHQAARCGHLNPRASSRARSRRGHIQRVRAVTMQTDAVGAQLHGAAILAGDLALLDQPQGLRHRLTGLTITAPGSSRGARLPSARYARSANTSSTAFKPQQRARRTSALPPAPPTSGRVVIRHGGQSPRPRPSSPAAWLYSAPCGFDVLQLAAFFGRFHPARQSGRACPRSELARCMARQPKCARSEKLGCAPSATPCAIWRAPCRAWRGRPHASFTGNIGRTDIRQNRGVVAAAFTEIGIEVDVHHRPRR